MSIYQLKKLNTKNGGHFFSRATMKHWGDTLKTLGIRQIGNQIVEVHSKREPNRKWLFWKRIGLMVNGTRIVDKTGSLS